MWAGYKKAHDVSEQEVSVAHRKSHQRLCDMTEKDGRSCVWVTKVLLCTRVITRTQLSFCAGKEDDKNVIETGIRLDRNVEAS